MSTFSSWRPHFVIIQCSNTLNRISTAIIHHVGQKNCIKITGINHRFRYPVIPRYGARWQKNSYARMWFCTKKHLSYTYITTIRVMTNWSSLLPTTCEYRDSFLHFYSNTTGMLHRLNKGHLITATDDVFLRAYFEMAIEAKKL